MNLIKYFLLFFSPLFLYAQGGKIHWMTEEYPPYNFTHFGDTQGIAIDVLKEVFHRGDIDTSVKDISVLPWVRGYRDAQVEGKQNVIFSTTRTDARESLFKWVGPISKTKVSVIALKDKNLSLKSMVDYSTVSFVAIREDIGEQLLEEKNANNIQSVTKVESALQMLKSGRAEAFAYEENVGKWLIKANGYNPSDFEIVTVLKEGELYYAFNKSVPDRVVAKYQKLVDQVLNDKAVMQKILDRYLK